MKIQGNTTTEAYSPLNINLPSKYEFEAEITYLNYGTSEYTAGIVIEGVSLIQNTNYLIIETLDNISTRKTYTKISVGAKVKFHYENNQVAVYVNNTLKDTFPINSNRQGVSLRTYSNWGIGIKNIEIKPL